MQELQPSSPKKNKNKVAILVATLAVVCFLAVPCVGVLAAIAIPAFIGYVQRSKTAEAESNLRTMFTLAAGYYDQESSGPGGSAGSTACTVSTERTSNVPSNTKSLLASPLGPSFEALGFELHDPVYYQYEIIGTGGCNHGPGENLYSFRAYGDLDGDGSTSLFEISASSDANNQLIRSPGIYRANELE